jgi:hypothetical protein
MEKVGKEQARYEDESNHLPEKCGNCAMYIPSSDLSGTRGQCDKVRGIIKRGGWCKFHYWGAPHADSGLGEEGSDEDR